MPAPASVGRRADLAAAPANQVSSDVQRFEAARIASEQRQVKSLADERAAKEADADLKVVGSRSFRRDAEGTWIDTKAKSAARTVTIKAYSAAYFALMRELPDIGALLAVGDNVQIEGRAVTIVIRADSGDTTLGDAALRDIVKDWR
jgi:hypothetical protein